MIQLAERLQAASAAKHWCALATIDDELTQLLPAMKAQRGWSAREQAALSVVRQAHRVAYENCLAEAGRLGKHLDEMQAHKEGWIAYSMNHDSAGENG
ncbi:MAG TPA: hypothetical protein VL051_14845 [Burkholderiaceae bacterium]|nr:hypothetical protein [Burkholderiaceae bacterium]